VTCEFNDGTSRRFRNVFDPDWYRNKNLDVDFGAIDPVNHYIHFGQQEGRQPHPLFDPSWYLRQLPELSFGNINLLAHFLDSNRPVASPHPLFDATWYLNRYTDVRESGRNPLEHYIQYGARAGYNPHPLFDATWYLDRYTDVRESGRNPLEHYIQYGAREGRNPHPLFDATWYRGHNSDAFDNPLIHYLSGKGRNPHPLFDEAYYHQQIKNLDVDNAALLLHFIVRGAAAGFDPNPYFDCAWYVGNHETLWSTGENPLAHFVRAGLDEDRDPHPLFDLDWYRFTNPDVAESGQNPLYHYLTSGRAQGRAGCPPNAEQEICAVLNIPYEIRRHPVIAKDRDVCVLVTYSQDGSIFPHTRLYLEALQANDIDVILTVVTDGLNQPLPAFTKDAAGLVVRINHGWDFAAWATVLAAIPGVWSARSLILANDSIFGPTDAGRFRDLMQRVRASKADIVALTDSYQVQHHLMSYFTVLKNRALTSKHVHRFWNEVRSIRDKQQVIDRYELSSGEFVKMAELDAEVLFPTQKRVDRDCNPTLEEWRGLITAGFPFVKVQLLRDRDRLAYSDTEGWREVMASNPSLLDAIDTYLTSPNKRPRSDAKGRPVPGPRRRFQRPERLTTFYGSVQSTRPSERTDLCLEVPFRMSVDAVDLPDKVAVLAHIFYPELCAEIRMGLRNVPVRTDLFISTDTNEKKAEIERHFAGFDGDVTVNVFPNIGRDIAPMIVGYADVFEAYEVFLHIHSKQSFHAPRLAPWRSFLTGNLLGSQEIVSSILALLTKTDVGIVFSDHFKPVRSLLNWGGNYDRVRSLLRRAGVDISKDIVLDFPSGSFFWGRTAAIRPLLALKLDWKDFDAEAGQIDGTLAHAIERTILYFAEAGGYSWTKVGRADTVAPERLVPVCGLEDVARAHQRLLGNRLPPLADRSFVPELPSICSRPDRRAGRARLNLIIPTLAPEHVFGGITTALRIFEEIAAALGPEYDLRIICQSLPLDLRAMVGFPDYCLVPMGTKDDFPRTIVDISDQESGEIGIRVNDIFLATAWWTASVAFDFQKRQKSYFGDAPRVLYLIQDHEPDFYGWSTQYGLAQQTYGHRSDMIALINSEELSAFMTASYAIDEAYLIRFKINPKIARSLKSLPRERIICIYARPSTPRNAFSLLCAGIAQWQRNNPEAARIWRIVAAGETFSKDRAGSIMNLSVAGKLSLGDYGELLSKASVGVSLMLSPHPSYPPLEMAAAGIYTITNSFPSKDLSRRNANVVSIAELTADALAVALDDAIHQAEERIGTISKGAEIKELTSSIPDFEASVIAGRIREMSALVVRT
jgi:lipopolysaccharide biosynthesis protein